MMPLRRVGMDTAQLTDEELIYIDNRIVETVSPQLVGRRLFPVETLPHAGFLTVRGYRRTDMGQARISLYGQGKNKDRSTKAAFDITVPVIHKEFAINWRDLEASRAQGVPIDTQDAENAARQCAEEEDKLLITGEYTGWNALGVEGLATATGRNTTSGGDWSANADTYVNNAIGELENDGHNGPYALVLKPSWWRQITGAYVSGTATKIAEKVEDLCTAGVYRTPNLFNSAGAQTNALVVELSKENFEMVIGKDLSLFAKQDEDMNLQCKEFEVVAPRIKRPTSICEITGLT